MLLSGDPILRALLARSAKLNVRLDDGKLAGLFFPPLNIGVILFKISRLPRLARLKFAGSEAVEGCEFVEELLPVPVVVVGEES